MQLLFSKIPSVHLPFTGPPASLILLKSGPSGALKVGMRNAPGPSWETGPGAQLLRGGEPPCGLDATTRTGPGARPATSSWATPQVVPACLGRMVLLLRPSHPAGPLDG